MMTLSSGLSLAATAAAVALSGAATVAPAHAEGAQTVHCYGINACKGQSDCKTAHNDCKGMNDCKGQGFKMLTAAACEAQGGSLTAPK
ncbi:BufA2 family periplasmic bufferin-type metallophore [Pedomonas mirosovicensis]|uniref:BufA2 family periplasmic bufferin-type metallophore n=1 Tax=Pedomonas mirosovicensis TaxID=2908641 RepID=UPI0021681686|nr:hypothetical protein [Pedomonas mirosovicensis]MCH8686554.1 hypothetical protein [Pedomonas mirosovicensis]